MWEKIQKIQNAVRKNTTQQSMSAKKYIVIQKCQKKYKSKGQTNKKFNVQKYKRFNRL